MKVLFLTDGLFPFQLGGMQKHSTIICQLLAEKGVDLEVVHSAGREYSQDRFNELFVGADVKEQLIQFPQLDKFPGHYVRESKAYSKQVYQHLESRLDEFDVIYTQGFTAWHFLQKKKRGVKIPPIFVNLHGLNMFQKAFSVKAKLENRLLGPMAKSILQQADYVYSFGGKLDDILLRLGIPKSKVLPQKNGVFEAQVYLGERLSEPSKRKFVFVGRNDKVKGLDILLKAVESLDHQNNFTLDLIGPIPPINHPYIHCHGEIRDEIELMGVLRESDCLICSSYSEGLPLVILEAMSQGLAIIATDVGASSSLINGNGLLVSRPTEIELRKAIQAVLDWDEDTLNLARNTSLNLIQKEYLWSKVIEQKLKDFKMAVKAQGPSN